VYAVGGLSDSRDGLKERLPRLATLVGAVARLLDARREHARQNVQMDALLQATQAFRSTWSAEALGASVCEHALRVTSATRACLVRLGGEGGGGEVQSVTPGHPIGVGLRVLEHSYTAAACADGVPRVWEDARGLDTSTPLYGAGERPRPVGSFGVVPLVREARVIGALVLEGDAPGDLLPSDLRPASLLAAMAAVSFETLSDIETIAHRARTDQLTGLASRLHFDEHLARMLAEADRYGGVVSLIVADVDHLAHATDEYGSGERELVLQAVARTLKDGARAVDLCARFGTEEIAILLPHTPLADACQVAERLRRAVESRVACGQRREVPVTASFGVASFPESVHRREELIPAVGRALDRARIDGRNCVRYAPQISSQQKS
jgi:diguanylate cyclase (GGDEF)-like protein